MFFKSSLVSDLIERFYSFCLVIDTIIYKFINAIFTLFMALSQVRIFSSDVVGSLTRRVYVILSVVMLFVIAYSLLRMIINPDELNKGKNSGFSVVKRIIVALAIIAFTPAIFDYAYGFQQAVLSNNVIGKTIMGSSGNDISYAASEFSTTVFSTNFYPTKSASEDVQEEYQQILESAKISGDVSDFGILIPNVVSKDVEYHNIISLIISGLVLYVLLTFCFDMATRVVKLTFLQMVAPVPALMYLLPNKTDTLGKWAKETFSCFFEVIVRVFVMYFMIFLFLVFNKSIDNGLILQLPTYGFIGLGKVNTAIYNPFMIGCIKLFVLFGLLAFVKQAPKLINDLLGIKTDNKMFNLKDRVKGIADTVKDITRPAVGVASKTVGTIGGVIGARQTYNKLMPQNEKSAAKSALATFNGLRNGFKGGFRGMGQAVNYEQLMQQSYALSSAEGKNDKDQILDALFDRGRGFIGRNTRYEDELMELKIKRDRKNARLRKNVENIDGKVQDRIDDIDRQHHDTLEANTKVKDNAKAFKDAVESQTIKTDSKFSIKVKSSITDAEAKQYESDIANAKNSGDVELAAKLQSEFDSKRGVYLSYISKLQADLQDANAKGNTSLAARIQQEIDLATAANTQLNLVNSKFDGNNFGIDAEIERIKEDTSIPEEFKRVLFAMYSHGKDLNNQAYVQDRTNWASDVKMAFSNLETSITADQDAGYSIEKVVDPTTGVIKYERKQTTDFKQILDEMSPEQILKIGKKASELVNGENEIKNKRLTDDLVSIEYIGSDGVSRPKVTTLYEWKNIRQHDLDEQKANNKEVERFEESHSSSKESDEAKHKARDISSKLGPKSGSNNK